MFKFPQAAELARTVRITNRNKNKKLAKKPKKIETFVISIPHVFFYDVQGARMEYDGLRTVTQKLLVNIKTRRVVAAK